RRDLRSSTDAATEAWERLKKAAEPFGGQYASSFFEEKQGGSAQGGFLTAAYARDIVKMYAMALSIIRNADGQLPGVLKEAHDSIWRLTQFWQWSGFAMRYGSIEQLAEAELGKLPRQVTGKYGLRTKPAAATVTRNTISAGKIEGLI
ncbi:MAG: hypothetical protein WA208_21205, partial [Thermoanaerobaculia bacterium]